MSDFNALPLAEQLKALEPGDELHLRGGGWLPFVEYGYQQHPVVFAASLKILIAHDKEDIIRIIRPSARKVPEVVEKLRKTGRLCHQKTHTKNCKRFATS